MLLLLPLPLDDTDTNSVIDLAASNDDSSRRHSSGSSISGNTVRSLSWANENDDGDENENGTYTIASKLDNDW